ncbi:hypothetical protein HYDPIDRAFT_66475, partial [Hydnomerulius pinastri MD-312]
YGEGMTFMGLFDSDQFAEERKTNLFYPFAGKEDWQIGHYLLASGLSMATIDKLLSLDWIKTLPLSFQTAKELRGRAELLPKGPQWKCQQIEMSHPTKSPVWLYWRDPIELLEALFSHPLFRRKIDLVPRKVYQTAAHLVRVYSEWMTGDAAWEMQGATLLGTILSLDKTNISAMTGDRVAHLLLIGLANIHSTTWLKQSSKVFLLAALLPVPKFIHAKQRMHGVLEDRLIHQCLDIVLAPLKIAAAIGVMMSDPFGDNFRHPPRTANRTLHQLARLTADPSTLEVYFKQSAKYRLNGVDKPFWCDWPLADPSVFLTPEPLHHLHKQFWDHDVRWCIHILGPKEIDFRFSVLQPITGYRHFNEGISHAKQVTGKEHRHIERYIVGVISGAAPRRVVVAIRALMDFCYMALCPVISDDGCIRIENALADFHAHKDAILTAEARRGKKKPINNWYIPKLELMQSIVPSIRTNGPIFQWSVDLTENAHITEIKLPSETTNNNNYDPQICRALDRAEKCRRFQLATAIQLSEARANDVCDDGGSLDEDVPESDASDDKTPLFVVPQRPASNFFLKAERLSENVNPCLPRPLRSFISGSVAFSIGYHPSMTRTLIDDVADKFHLPDLRPALADYFEHERRSTQVIHPIGGPWRALVGAPLPFDHVQVWYKVRLQRASFHDSKILLPLQTVNAMPPDKQWPHGRHDAVLVCTDQDQQWPKSGLEGHKVAELQLVLRPLSPGRTASLWNDRFLAYVQRFDFVPQPNGGYLDRDTQLPVIRRVVRSNGRTLGDIIPLSQIRELVNIIPHFGAHAESQFTKSNSAHYSTTFFLNNYFTKDQYYALS